MAEKSHLKLISKESVKTWNKLRERHPKVQIDLKGADLNYEDLSGADLSKANLIEADLRWAHLSKANLAEAKLRKANLSEADLSLANLRNANLTRADLRKVNLSKANLSHAILILASLNGANLNKANLSEAKLTQANLIKAKLSQAILIGAELTGANLSHTNLSHSDISGANITGTNQHKWNIKGIKCTHIIWNDKTIKYTNPDDFEKAFTRIKNVVAMILDMPFSNLGHHTGRIIEQEINRKYGEGSLRLKGQTAISDDTTKFEFISFSASDELTEIKNVLSELQNKLNPVIEEAKSKSENQSPLGFKSEIDIPGSFGALVARPKELERVLIERYAQWHPLLQNIVHTIQLHIR